MKKYNMLLLLQARNRKMRKLLERRIVQNTQVLKLSKQIDRLQNKLYY